MAPEPDVAATQKKKKISHMIVSHTYPVKHQNLINYRVPHIVLINVYMYYMHMYQYLSWEKWVVMDM